MAVHQRTNAQRVPERRDQGPTSRRVLRADLFVGDVEEKVVQLVRVAELALKTLARKHSSDAISHAASLNVGVERCRP